LNSQSLFPAAYRDTVVDRERSGDYSVPQPEKPATAHKSVLQSRFPLTLCTKPLSAWSRSHTKRLFDCCCVLLALPLLFPILVATAIAVRLTSFGPVFFLQKRMGRQGTAFTIIKFRTMVHVTGKTHHAVTTAGNQQFTLIGPFLRRYKLDELPQLLNVLWGDMSLVGPRPKLPEHETALLTCRPGITGEATIAFAREEVILDDVPAHRLKHYYHSVVLPTKRRLDEDYMARATFSSDLRLLINSVLRRWDTSTLEGLVKSGILGTTDTVYRDQHSFHLAAPQTMPIPATMDVHVPDSQGTFL